MHRKKIPFPMCPAQRAFPAGFASVWSGAEGRTIQKLLVIRAGSNPQEQLLVRDCVNAARFYDRYPSAGASFLQHGGDGLQEDIEIGSQTPVHHIRRIERGPLGVIDVGPPGDLPKP